MTKENPNIKHPYEWANEFDRKRGLALGMALAVENGLEFFISNYFIRPQHSKTFFFDEVVTQRINFTGKIRLFKDICEREKFDKEKVKKLMKLIEEIKDTRNKIAHREVWANPQKKDVALVKRGEVVSPKDYLRLTDEFMDEFDKKRYKAVTGISDFYLKYSSEGTIDEKHQKIVDETYRKFKVKDNLRACLLKKGIKVLDEKDGYLVWEAIIDKLPENHRKNVSGENQQREYIHIIPPFIIKSPDKEKQGLGKTEEEEIRTEIGVWREHKDIPIVPKIAILKLDGEDKYFLVEEFHLEYADKNSKILSEGVREMLSKDINEIRKNLDEKYVDLDHKDDNFVFDLANGKLLLTDICVANLKQKGKNAK